MKRMDLSSVPWEELDRFPDRTIFQTLPWLRFLAATQAAEPIVCAIREDGHTIGYFTGLVARKLGFRILGSPFRGWTTAYMGFNLPPGYPRQQALQAVPSFAFRELGCQYLEIMDRYIQREDCSDQSYEVQWYQNMEVDLTQSEDLLFANMSSACRRCIRKADKCGVSIEEASDMGFADDFYPQLEDVFAKQSLVPTYGVERVRELIRHLLPTGQLLLLRAISPEGICIATGIFPAFNDTAYFFAGASWREHQILRPNEALMWYAMKYWKARGIERFDMGGKARYKTKYGVYRIEVPLLIKARYESLFALRNLAQRAYKLYPQVVGWLKTMRERTRTAE